MFPLSFSAPELVPACSTLIKKLWGCRYTRWRFSLNRCRMRLVYAIARSPHTLVYLLNAHPSLVVSDATQVQGGYIYIRFPFSTKNRQKSANVGPYSGIQVFVDYGGCRVMQVLPTETGCYQTFPRSCRNCTHPLKIPVAGSLYPLTPCSEHCGRCTFSQFRSSTCTCYIHVPGSNISDQVGRRIKVWM